MIGERYSREAARIVDELLAHAVTVLDVRLEALGEEWLAEQAGDDEDDRDAWLGMQVVRELELLEAIRARVDERVARARRTVEIAARRLRPD